MNEYRTESSERAYNFIVWLRYVSDEHFNNVEVWKKAVNLIEHEGINRIMKALIENRDKNNFLIASKRLDELIKYVKLRKECNVSS